MKARVYWVDEKHIAFVYKWMEQDTYKLVIQNTKYRSRMRNIQKRLKFFTYDIAQKRLDKIAEAKGWKLKSEMEI